MTIKKTFLPASLNFLFAEKLLCLFKSLAIDAVYLYGSRAEGLDDTLSDYDFGLLFDESLNSDERYQLRLSLFCEIASCLNVSDEEIDVVDLVEVPTILQFNIISGKLIYCRNEEKKVLLESKVMGKFNDEHYYFDRDLAETMEKIKKGVYFERQISYA